MNASSSGDVDIGEFFAEEAESLPVFGVSREAFEHPERSFIVGIAHGVSSENVAYVFIAGASRVHEAQGGFSQQGFAEPAILGCGGVYFEPGSRIVVVASIFAQGAQISGTQGVSVG